MASWRQLIRRPVPVIEWLLCFRIFTIVLCHLLVDYPHVVLMIDLISIGIWLAFVLLIGHELTRFEYIRWQCSMYCQRVRRQRRLLLLDGGNHSSSVRSTSNESSRCRWFLQKNFTRPACNARASNDSGSFCATGMDLRRCPDPFNFHRDTETLPSEPIEDLEQQRKDWKVRLARKIWRSPSSSVL